jgi:type I restriction enzyme S subunit
MKKPVAISPETSCFPDNELPEGWKFVTILDACEVNPPKPSKDFLPADAPVTFVPMPAVDADMGAITNPQIKPYLEVRNGFTSFRDGDVIMAKITPCMENGKAAIVHGMKNGIGFGSTEFHVMRSRGEIIPDYLYYYIRQESFRNEAESHFTGSVGQKRVPADFIKQRVIPLPPLAEQQRIVARVEALLSHVNAARDRLSRVPLIMKKFRQAVLAAGCSGRLTEGWRGGNPDVEPVDILKIDLHQKYKKSKFDDRELPQLPEKWRWTKLFDTVEINMGQSPPGDSYNQNGEGIPLINGPVEFGPTPFSETIKSKFTTHTTKLCKQNDLLLCVRGSTTGRINIAGFDACIGRGVAALRSTTDQKYLTLFIHSQEDFIYSLGTGSTFPNISSDTIANLDFPLPPLAEQYEIVRRVGLLFERADAFDREVAAVGRRCERLTQAVLGKAFAGKL